MFGIARQSRTRSRAYPSLFAAGNVYGASKAFVKQFALNLRADGLGSNVRVTNIEPGLTDTDFMLVRFGGDAEKKERFNQGVTPMTAEDIAEAIFWSCTLPRNVNINRIQMMPITQARQTPMEPPCSTSGS